MIDTHDEAFRARQRVTLVLIRAKHLSGVQSGGIEQVKPNLLQVTMPTLRISVSPA